MLYIIKIKSELKTGKYRLLVHQDTKSDGMDNSNALSKSEIPTKMDKLNKVLLI